MALLTSRSHTGRGGLPVAFSSYSAVPGFLLFNRRRTSLLAQPPSSINLAQSYRFDANQCVRGMQWRLSAQKRPHAR
jgi:hypothetical protein